MEIEDVKALIRGLLVSSTRVMRVADLLRDFKSNSGIGIPRYGYPTVEDFLHSLTDTLVISRGDVYPVSSNKSVHVEELVSKQKITSKNGFHRRRNSSFNPTVIPSIAYMKSFPPNPIFNHHPSTLEHKHQPKDYVPPLSNTDKSKLQMFLDTCTDGASYPEVIQLLNNFYWRGKNLSLNKKVEEVLCQCPFACVKDRRVYSVEKLKKVEEAQRLEAEVEEAGSGSICINTAVKLKIKNLVKMYADGVWCSEIPDLYYQQYKQVLDYREFGCISLIQLLSSLHDVVQCIRPDNCDWKIFLAGARIPHELSCKKPTIPKFIKDNISSLLSSPGYSKSNGGLPVNLFLSAYLTMFGTQLDISEFNCSSLDVFLEELDGKVIKLRMVNNVCVLLPLLKKREGSSEECDALPPLGPGEEGFSNFFPPEVLGPTDIIPDIDLTNISVVGNCMLVRVAEVWTPQNFSLHLDDNQKILDDLMDGLQNFYRENDSEYVMPSPTIQPDQFCVCYHGTEDLEPEWHRAKIIARRPNNRVLCSFIDYGTSSRVMQSKLRFLHKQFADHPALAFRGSIYGIAPPHRQTKWSMETNKRFLQLVTEKTFAADVVKVDSHKPCVHVQMRDISIPERSLLSDVLINEGLAVRDTRDLFDCSSVNCPELTDDNSVTVPECLPSPVLVNEPEEKIINTVDDENYLFPSDTIRPATDLELATGSKPRRDEKTEVDGGLMASAVVPRPPPGFASATPNTDVLTLLTTTSQLIDLERQRRQKEVNNMAVHIFMNDRYTIELARLDSTLAMKYALSVAEEVVPRQLVTQVPTVIDVDYPTTWPSVDKPVVQQPLSPVCERQLPAPSSAGGSKYYEGGYCIVDDDTGVNSEAECVDMDISGDEDVIITSSAESSPGDNHNTSSTSMSALTMKKFEVCSRLLHVVNIDNELYVCCSELVDLFTKCSTLKDALDDLKKKDFDLEFLEKYRHLDPEFFRVYDSCDVRGRTSLRIDKVILITLSSSQQFIHALGPVRHDIYLGLNQLIHELSTKENYRKFNS